MQFNGFYYIHRVVQPTPLCSSKIIPKGDPRPIKYSLLIPLSHQALTTTNLSVAVDLPILDISYQWNRTICSSWCLASLLSVMFSRCIHVLCCHMYQFSFLFMAEEYSSIWMDHTLFIHSSFDGQLTDLCSHDHNPRDSHFIFSFLFF